MPSSRAASPSPSSPSSSTIISPSSYLTLSSDLSAASPQHLYRLSSQYFLTKHFAEASHAIQPLLTSPERKWQQKAWGLYLAILDNALKLGDEEGRKSWGRQGWEQLRMRVKSTNLWDELLDSVQGVKSLIEPEVVMAIIQVSLHHGDTKVCQLKVEEWLAAVPPPFPLQSSELTGLTNGEVNGISKQKDFYGKVLELYCLSLLPRNEDWEFAKTFIHMNEYLSEHKKSTYFKRIDDLKVEAAKEKAKPPLQSPPTKSTTSSRSSPKLRSPSSKSPSSKEELHELPPSPSETHIPANSSPPAPSPRTLSTLANRLFRHPSRYFRHFLTLLQDLSQDDSFLRTLLFAMALIVALVRRDVRARLRLAFAWVSRKVRETIVMGGKVGYL